MTEERSLLSLIHQLVVDDSVRSRLLHAPRETLIDELGISGETYQALMTVVPILVAGGLVILQGSADGGPGIDSWGSWGRWP